MSDSTAKNDSIDKADKNDGSDIQAHIDRTRAELAATLNELEDKLNVPKQLGIAGHRAKSSFSRDPLPWVAGAGVAALALAGVVVAAVRSR
ncbi:DUF3618 domain-containing protein [Frigoribacterium sp. CFBP 13729]|uniref:DUF3618 domain-containing protein n=1 Tax=Frigoribacterium sp. CFBP 13729 TaxID=2775293 RepID=UPI0017877B73|nr:DUF3618 domain-containing protein [Frigoribacterium sp. CFBP 13729]